MDNLDIVRAWQRRHSDGTMGLVKAYRNGTFSGELHRPASEVGIDVGSRRPDVRTLRGAMNSADIEAGHSGHRCGRGCEAWQEISINNDPN